MKTKTNNGFLITIAEIKDIVIAARNTTVVSHLFLSNIDLICLTNPTRNPVLTDKLLSSKELNFEYYPIIANKFPIE